MITDTVRSISNRELYSSMLVVLLVIPTLTAYLPIWVIGELVFFLVLVTLINLLPQKRHVKKIRFLLALTLLTVSLMSTLFYFHTVLGIDAASSLFLGLLGAKFCEASTKRDFHVLHLALYLLLLIALLYNQQSLIAIYLFCVFIFNILLLATFQTQHLNFSLKKNVALIAFSCLVALPLAILLFLFFPRISPLWASQIQNTQAKSGVSDHLSPEGIENLLLSEEVAFRANFSGKQPKPDHLYWRGLVLAVYDGKKWTRSASPAAKMVAALPATNDKSAYTYSIFLTKAKEKWLYVLDFPYGSLPANTQISTDFELFKKFPKKKIATYQIKSLPEIPSLKPAFPHPKNLQLPAGKHLKTVQLGKSWSKKNLSQKEILQTAITLFKTGGFVYSLSPGKTDGDLIDNFIFSSKQGFCAHYASAFAILMRAAGVPTRVVVGYYGGERNKDYYLIRQKNAHAWNEVWLDEQKRWVRIDPTQYIHTLFSAPTKSLTSKLEWFKIKTILFFDDLSFRWSKWVLGYDHKKQIDLLNKIGTGNNIAGWGKVLGIILLLYGGIAIAIILLKSQRPTVEVVIALFRSFCHQVQKKTGVIITRGENASDYIKRAGSQNPHLKKEMLHVVALYHKIRYQNKKHLLSDLLAAIKQFSKQRDPKK